MSLKTADLKTGSVSAKRKDKIKAAVAQAEGELKGDALEAVAQQTGVDKAKILEKYPHKDPEIEMQRALVRKRVSEIMFEADKQELTPDEQNEVVDRQINRYYDFEIADKEVAGFVDSVHGIKPPEDVNNWCKDKKIAGWEEFVNDIAKKVPNWMTFKLPRVFTDVNNLPKKTPVSIRSDSGVFTKEFNINAVKAQRDLTKKVLKHQGLLSENGEASRPVLAVYLHGKADKQGSDFEIGAKQREGKGPIDPLLAFWIKDKLAEKIKAKGVKNDKGDEATVNVVANYGAYSGSSALTRMRYGDGVFDFKGFGENLQALQLECGHFVREKHGNQIAEIIKELLAEFSTEFKTSEDLVKLKAKYDGFYEKKIEEERVKLFDKNNVLFPEDMAETEIALGASVREALEIEVGETLELFGSKFKVVQMKKEHLREGKYMMINKKFEDKFSSDAFVKKDEVKLAEPPKTPVDSAQAPQQPQTEKPADESQKSSLWQKIKSPFKRFWSWIKS